MTDSTLKLRDILGDPEVVVANVFAHATWTGTRIKTTRLFQEVATDWARGTVINYAHGLVLEPLAVMYDKFEQRNGARPAADGLPQQEWDSALDDEVASVVEPYAGIVSAGWLGQHTVDTLLHQPGEIQKFANDFSREVWGQLSYHKTPAQLMAALGFTAADVDAYVSTQVPATPINEGTDMSETISLAEVLNSIMLNYQMGLLGDQAALLDNLDQASDTDDTLMEGAAERLYIDHSSALLLRVARANGSTPETWASMIVTGDIKTTEGVAVLAPAGAPEIEEVEGGPDLPESLKRVPPPPPVAAASKVPPPPAAAPTRVPPPPPVTSGGAAASVAPKTRKRQADPPPAGHIPQHVLVTIKDATQLKDDDLAILFGVSRPTMNNYLRGKGYCTPTPEQRKAVAERIEAKATALVEALQLLTS